MRSVAYIFGLLCVVAVVALAWMRFDRWVDMTDLPPLVAETSVEMRDRSDGLLRVYTVDDGRWRLATGVAQVDPLYLDMLIAFEDKRFFFPPRG